MHAAPPTSLSPSRPLLSDQEMAIAEENVRRAIKNGDLAGLSAERLEELSVELEKPLGTDEYTCLYWACHYGKRFFI